MPQAGINDDPGFDEPMRCASGVAAGAVGSAKRITAPRVRTIQPGKNDWWGRYKGHDIFLSRDSRKDDWWIDVQGPDGMRAYQGTWRDSAGKTRREAILEALRGSLLWPNEKGQR